MAQRALQFHFPSWDQQHLTQDLAQNSRDLVVLRQLRQGDVAAAIGEIELELDVRALTLDELLKYGSADPVVRENREKIHCHLAAIANYRATIGPGVTHEYPEIAAMATLALSLHRCPTPADA